MKLGERNGQIGWARAWPEGGGPEDRDRPLKRVVLGEWEEYVGWLDRIEEGPDGWVAVFDHTAVALPDEVDGLRQLIGKRVGILRTDDAERPIRMRAIPDLQVR